MFWKKKTIKPMDYDKENWKPVLHCSICNGEQVAGFKNLHTGEFREECFIRDEKELEQFKERYQISEITREY